MSLSPCSSVDSGETLASTVSSTPSTASSSTATPPDTPPSEEGDDVGLKRCFWDWPLSVEDGMACAEDRPDSFKVRLDFGRLHKPLGVKRFENFAACSSSWSVGLSPAPTTALSGEKKPSQYHWRLEIQIMRPLHMILIETTREVFRNNKGRTMKRIRKMYRIPERFDMNTLNSEMTESGAMIFTVLKKQNKPVLTRARTIA